MGGLAPRSSGAAPSPDEPQRRVGWSVRTDLIAIAAAVAIVFIVAGSIASKQVLDNARRNARLEAESLVSVVAGVVGDTVALGAGQLIPLTQHPEVPALLAQPTPCPLDFALDLFVEARLDLVRPDGTVACSSRDGLSGQPTHAQAGWLAEVADATEVIGSRPEVDAVTGQVSVVLAAPVRDGGGALLGSVAMVLPTAGVADRLAELFGGPRGYQVALLETRSGALLDSSADLDGLAPGDANGGPDPMHTAGYLSAGGAVPDTTWRAAVGITPEAALGRAYSVLLRGALVGGAAYLVLLVALAVVYQRIARPLRHLTDVASSTGPQQGDALDLVRGPAEVVRLANSFRAAISTHEAYEDQLVHQALHDPLTGLPNRALLTERLTHSLQQATRSRNSVAVLFLDLDGFKLVNESLGHAVGDQVLCTVATRLKEILRPGDTLARFGGDEFVVVAEAVDGRAQAERLAERLLAVVQTPILAGGITVRVSASVGIALSDRSSVPAALISDADNALYLAKERGRSRHEVFDLSLRDRVTTRLTVANELQGALERGGFHLVYQPQIDLTSGTAVGVEALLRWNHPGLGTIPPATFIPIAEDTGSIVPLGRFVLEEACRQAAAWRDQGLDLTVAVNLSGRQLAEPELVDHVAEVLAETGVAASQLCLELTESVLMHDTPRTADALADLHDLGVRLSIDDFGTGYSSLAYLHRFPVDHLKIDRAFIKGMVERTDQRTLVRAMVAMGSALGLDIVAEGVETPEQAQHLRVLGCHTAQGFHFAPPQPAGSLQPLLRRSARTASSTIVP